MTIRRYLDISLLLWMDKLDSSLAGVFDEPPKLVAAAGNRVSVNIDPKYPFMVKLHDSGN